MRAGEPPTPAVLDREVQVYQSLCFSDSTKRCYSAHLRSYTRFCNSTGVPLAPASSDTLCRYVAFLARRLSYNSIKQYLNIVRLLHLERGMANPLEGDFRLTTTLRGIRRHLGDRVQRKIPITPPLLLSLLGGLDISQPTHACIWAAALLMFYGMLRRGNVLVTSMKEFDPRKHLCRRDISFHRGGLAVCIRWSKTNQFRTTEMVIPYPRIKGHPLCPTQAVFHALRLTEGAPMQGPALVLPGRNRHPLSPVTFVKTVKRILHPHVQDISEVGGHSFRRGGACWALAKQVPIDTIRQLAGWSSNCYTAYVLSDTSGIKKATEAMTVDLPTST